MIKEIRIYIYRIINIESATTINVACSCVLRPVDRFLSTCNYWSSTIVDCYGVFYRFNLRIYIIRVVSLQNLMIKSIVGLPTRILFLISVIKCRVEYRTVEVVAGFQLFLYYYTLTYKLGYFCRQNIMSFDGFLLIEFDRCQAPGLR